jgi:hypothetical protein
MSHLFVSLPIVPLLLFSSNPAFWSVSTPSAAQAVSASMITFNARKGKYTYWLHSFLQTLFSGFAGGFIAPLFMAQRSGPLENDFTIPILALAWYVTHYCGAHRLWTSTWGKIGHVALLALFRTHSVINFTLQAGRVFPANRYPSCAIFGPIFCATLSGCCGLFFPQRGEGFAAVEKETPWAVQGAFITATLSHLMLNDKTGPLGQTVRAVLGSWDKNALVVAIGTMQLVTLFLQNYSDVDANLFAPVHRLLYCVSGVSGPVAPPAAAAATAAVCVPTPNASHSSDKGDAFALTEDQSERQYERWLNRAKIAACVLGCMCIIAQRVPPTALAPGGYLEVGDVGLAHCVWMQSFRDCIPLRLNLKLEGQGQGQGGSGSGVHTYTLALYGPGSAVRWRQTVSVAASPSAPPNAKDMTVATASASGSGTVRAYVDTSGSVVIAHTPAPTPSGADAGEGEQSQRVLWRSSGTCSGAALGGWLWPLHQARLAIDPQARMPVVVCPFGDRISLELQGEGLGEGQGQGQVGMTVGNNQTAAAGEL